MSDLALRPSPRRVGRNVPAAGGPPLCWLGGVLAVRGPAA
jgi:hypothetical protein